MSIKPIEPSRIFSGMRPTGPLHLGNYHGALKNWLVLQQQYECFFAIVDWHALTTDYENPMAIADNILQVATDWLAVGIDPKVTRIFVQSHVPEHALMHLLLSMITPLGWLERVPTYKEQRQKLKDRDLSTYGFLGYPLLQAADVLLYKATQVPVGEDQIPHIELIREIARHFNHLYGQEANFQTKAQAIIDKLNKQQAALYHQCLKKFQQDGDLDALTIGKNLVASCNHLSTVERERLLGFLVGVGRMILPEPQVLLTKTSKLTGLDGQKMSKSYHNTIQIREKPENVSQKIRTMPTDPARIRRTDPGDPEKCPVWELHKVYGSEEIKAWIQNGCRTAGIGCLECKQPLIDAIVTEQAPILERAKPFEENPDMVRKVLAEGATAARDIAKTTLAEVNTAMGLGDF